MIVLVLALFATYSNQEAQLNRAHAAQIAACERGNKLRRQIRVQNVILQDLVAASRPLASSPLDAVLDVTLQRLRDQYNGSDVAAVSCAREIP